MGAKKILVVDFDREFLKFLSQFLRNEGFAVVTAADGFAGLEMHKSEAPDLVITEAMLPKLHGFELCSRISHSPARKTPVVIVTGVYRDTVYKTEALHTFGASAYFEKPLNTDELMVSLRKILGLAEMKESKEEAENPIDEAIMEAIASGPATSLAQEKPTGKSSADDAVDNMLRSTLAEFGLKSGKGKTSAAPPALKPRPPAPPAEPEPLPVKPVSAARPRPAVAVPTAPPVWAPQAVMAPSGVAKPKPLEPVVPLFGGYTENKKKGFPPRLFGAVAGVLVLTSATLFFLKPGKGRLPTEKAVPQVFEEFRTGFDPFSPAVETTARTAPVSEAGNRKGAGPAPAKAKPRQTDPAVEAPPLLKPEDIDPMSPEASPNLEIRATETAPSPAGTTPIAADGGAVAAGTEAPVEIPVVKVRAGDLIPLEEADVPPRQIRTADPVYPSAARNLGKEGSIMINVLISETGDVIQTAVIGGDKGSLGFDKAAENAIRKWKFSPAEKGGVPVRVWKPVTIGFKLKK
jgi:TonB family protein